MIFVLVVALASAAHGQEIRNVTFGWGRAMRLGRWTPVFVTVEDPQTREIDLQIRGSYGEKGLALWLHQSAVAQPLPVTYGLLYPINSQLSRIEVIVSDAQTGRTLGTQPLQSSSAFTPAGRVPIHLFGPNDTFIGISGDVDSALRLQTQLDIGEIPAGVLDPMKLPSNFAGYDGINLLILAAADIASLTGDQEQAMLDWVARGGNLLVIPGTLPLPPKSALLDALPCALGENRTVMLLSGVGDEKGWNVNCRYVSPRPGAQVVPLPDNQQEYLRRWGLGKIALVPFDLSALAYMRSPQGPEADAQAPRTFWKPILDPMVNLPAIANPSEQNVAEEEQNIVSGPNAAESFGRGQRESEAIHHVLETLGATGTQSGGGLPSALLALGGIFFLIGPIDSILLFRFGYPPRTWLTLIGWIGLLTSVGLYAANKAIHAKPTAAAFRLVDQVDDRLVGATDVIAVNSTAPGAIPLSLDKTEWWEPANQAARSFSPDRFVDAQCREDKTGCRPEFVRLNGREAQSWHGEVAGIGGAMLKGDLKLVQDNAGVAHLTGSLTNVSATSMSDIFVMTAGGTFRLQQSISPGASVDVNAATTSQPMSLDGLPEDVLDVSPERADAMGQVMKNGHAVVVCQMPDAQEVKVGQPVDQHWQVLRAAVAVSRVNQAR